MFFRVFKFSLFTMLFVSASIVAYAQPDDFPEAIPRSERRGGGREDKPAGLREMIAKQRIERSKKDHEELLERGEEALKIAHQLELSFAQNKGFSPQDQARLESLEKVVTKIRKELGGDDDDDDGDVNMMRSADEPRPSNMEEAFRFLQSTTVKLVDELKKTTRFTISAVAIQSTNSVLKLVRFLRLRR